MYQRAFRITCPAFRPCSRPVSCAGRLYFGLRPRSLRSLPGQATHHSFTCPSCLSSASYGQACCAFSHSAPLLGSQARGLPPRRNAYDSLGSPLPPPAPLYAHLRSLRPSLRRRLLARATSPLRFATPPVGSSYANASSRLRLPHPIRDSGSRNVLRMRRTVARRHAPPSPSPPSRTLHTMRLALSMLASCAWPMKPQSVPLDFSVLRTSLPTALRLAIARRPSSFRAHVMLLRSRAERFSRLS